MLSLMWINKKIITRIFKSVAVSSICLIPLNVKAESVSETMRYAIYDLVDEVIECAVYYSIMGAGEDSTGNLTEHSQRFLGLTEQLGLMAFNLADSIDLKGEVIESKVVSYSKKMSQEIGGDSINISILINKHGEFCKGLVEDPEARLSYWIQKEAG